MEIPTNPSAMIDLLRAWFFAKDRSIVLADNTFILNKIHSWSIACSLYQNIPGLVGFWPMSSVQRSTGNAYDLSGQNRTLTYNGNPTYNFDGLVPYIAFDGTGDYLSRADETDLDILGTETIYNSAIRGLTVGGWFWFNDINVSRMLISKRAAAGNASWNMRRAAGSHKIDFRISTDGTAFHVITHSTIISANKWYFCVGRFEPSIGTSTIINADIETNSTATPASIFNSSANLEIGAFFGSTQVMNGRATLCFLSANALSDTIITNLFQQTRRLFGV